MTATNPISHGSQRLLSIDVLRGITVGFMIQVNNKLDGIAHRSSRLLLLQQRFGFARQPRLEAFSSRRSIRSSVPNLERGTVVPQMHAACSGITRS